MLWAKYLPDIVLFQIIFDDELCFTKDTKLCQDIFRMLRRILRVIELDFLKATYRFFLAFLFPPWFEIF